MDNWVLRVLRVEEESTISAGTYDSSCLLLKHV